MFTFFTKPYPYLFTPKRSIIGAIIIGLFIGISTYFILGDTWIFQNFSISITQMSFYFGLITFASIILVFGLITSVFISEKQRDNWTFIKEISLYIVLIIIISILNFILISFVSIIHFDEPFKIFIYDVLPIVTIFAIIPVSIRIWLNYTLTLLENLQNTQSFNEELVKMMNTNNKIEKEEIVALPTNNLNEIIKFDLNKLLFIRAENNYIEVYIKDNDKVVNRLYRASVQIAEDKLCVFPQIVRTHRSYLVNIKNIKTTTGNARNYQLFFEGTDRVVPVARGRFKEFNAAFSS